MNRFQLTSRARRDIQSIVAWIAKDNPDAAQMVNDKLREEMRLIGAMPGVGHIRQDAPAKYRFRTVYSYLIVYLPDRKPIQIVRVVHGARDIKTLFRKK